MSAGPESLIAMGRVEVGLLLLLLAAAACAEAQPVRTEIVPLAEGEFYGANWGGSQLQRFYAVARPGMPSARTAEAVLVSPEHEAPCSLGDDVASYLALQPRSAAKYVLGSPSPARVLLFRQLDMDGFGTLSFADIDCGRMDFEVSGVSPSRNERWNLYEPDLVKTKLALRTRERALIFVDPWAQEQHEVARDVSFVWDYDQGMWLIEGGQLVRRDLEGKEVLRRGRGVRQVLPLGDEGDYAYIDEQGAFVVRGDQAKRIGPADACGLSQYDAFMPHAFGYYSPCAEHRLVITSEDGSKRFEYTQQFDGNPIQQPGMLFFIRSDDTTTTLFRVRSSEPSTFEQIDQRERYGLLALIPYSAGVNLMLTQEADASYRFSLLDLTGARPARHTLRSGIARVPEFGDSAISVLYGDGDLVVYDRMLGKELWRVQGVAGAPARFVFRGKSSALAYLTHFDSQTRVGRLELHLLSGEHFVIDEGVREYSEVWWPERGLLYTKSGAGAGIKFARVDIPCESTSDTAWACGF